MFFKTNTEHEVHNWIQLDHSQSSDGLFQTVSFGGVKRNEELLKCNRFFLIYVRINNLTVCM